jgi:large subunit ribosomal protein L29
MKAVKFFEMSTEELQNTLNEKKSDLFNLRFKQVNNQLSNPAVMVECRRDIAKIKTVLRQRELGITFEPAKIKKGSKK